MSKPQIFIKRLFDLFFSIFLLSFLFPVILLAWLVASFDTNSNGFFFQERVGRYGKLFKVIKIKTMVPIEGITSTISVSNDIRITKIGSFFRKYKIDELPQLINVLLGDMSFVGPRPDVQGYADTLSGYESIILNIRPGITGPASIKYSNEEFVLSGQKDPKKYNDEIIWPDKVKINVRYIEDYTFLNDLKYIFKTL